MEIQVHNNTKQLDDGFFPGINEVTMEKTWIHSYMSETPRYTT